jgi:hypothetical protein
LFIRDNNICFRIDFDAIPPCSGRQLGPIDRREVLFNEGVRISVHH